MVRITSKLVIGLYITLIFLFIVLISFLNQEEPKGKQEVKKEKVKIENKVEYTKMKATAYTAGYESTGKTPSDDEYGVTASGKIVSEGRTIACPRTMSFGTKVYVKEMNKTYVCEDRGSAITSGRIDIYIASLDEALEFGVKEVNVLVK